VVCQGVSMDSLRYRMVPQSPTPAAILFPSWIPRPARPCLYALQTWPKWVINTNSMIRETLLNKVVTKPQARSNCDVTSFRSNMGTDGPTNQRTDQPTNIVSYRGATSRLKMLLLFDSNLNHQVRPESSQPPGGRSAGRGLAA
jgi:hypothetical protein